MSQSKKTLNNALNELEEELALDKVVLDRILNRFMDRMDHGLANLGQDMAMIPTFGELHLLSDLITN